ncbi:MAG: Gfo/Idh/MocA family oxidoreductase [Candidatus Omnitrophica bacterium]|nr:Gfo/Idh/MocA family oxidoreductase [bacterium]MBK7494941.1 Gfo/Idh/MocA family oxidoreductase [Candidatus Omnitrophota bacterium]MCE7907181.1 gfo/Idh/MocA family oxidoreductase [Candidatus Omnitrophica bacterium COP1]MBV6480462.1 Myo-inositol 2-dehydrogenase [bacterium]MCC6733619.1 Gfo/Idh/MocA family oxidoreductase [Candidatus Omnitrophota bacterium]
MSKTLKVGVIGVGGIAHTHFPGWQESPHTEIVALSDVSAEALKSAGEKTGATKLFEKGEDLIACKEIDVVDICTPNMYHTPLTVAALEAGKHVICEKPLAPQPDDIRKMIAARDKSGKMLMTAQHFRFEGSSKALKAEVDKGVLGNVYHARCWMLRRSGAPTRPGFIQKKHSGGGPCIDIGVHILDLTLWMMGQPKPVTVTGVTQDKLRRLPGAFSNWGGPIPADWDVEEFASAFVRFENGATLVLEVSWLLNHPKTHGEDMQMWLYGDKGGAHWPQNVILTTDNATCQHFDTQLQNAESGEPHAKECMAFAEAIIKGEPSPVPAEQSLDVIAILDALYKSAQAGREVCLK